MITLKVDERDAPVLIDSLLVLLQEISDPKLSGALISVVTQLRQQTVALGILKS